MKTLKDFIKESQEINEGLISEIILKLLDASIKWIGDGAKWLADQSVKATSEVWNSGKQMYRLLHDDFYREYPDLIPKNAPTNAKEAASLESIIDNDPNISADDKIKSAKKQIKNIKSDSHKGSQPGAIEDYIVYKIADTYTGITENPKATSEDKQKAEKFLKEILSSESDNIRKRVYKAIKEYKEQKN